jgi:glutathione S-transferase
LLDRRIDFVAKALEGRDYLMGDAFTVADCYLFTVLNWAHWVKIDLSRWPSLTDYLGRIAERPSVQAALKAEGLVKS